MGVRAHSNEVTVCLQAQLVQAALSGGGVGDGVAAYLMAFHFHVLKDKTTKSALGIAKFSAGNSAVLLSYCLLLLK